MPELDARLLICHAAGLAHEAFVAQRDGELFPEAGARLQDGIARRLAREPVSRIVGMREFYGRAFLVDRHTLDPRPDTETAIDAALDMVARNGWDGRRLRLLDLGTGTGCILLTLLAELPLAEGAGTDKSLGALALAAENARRLRVADRAAFVAGDWLAPLGGAFDLILANPPYLTAAEMAALPGEVTYDPRFALDGGPDGLDAYRRIAAEAGQRLRPGGLILLEIGSTQAEAVLELLSAAGLSAGENAVRHDLAGRPRCVVVRRPPELRAEGRMPKKDLEIRDVQVRFGSEIVTWPSALRGAAGCNGNKSGPLVNLD
jgi:release factor glutamine methyltransferase